VYLKNLKGRYDILSQLGAGAMGVVYLAHDSQTQQQVAIKVLPIALAHNPTNLQRFEREVRALQELNHPNIVRYLDHFEEEGDYFLVMAYLSGGSLADRLQQGTFTPAAATQIIQDLADTLTWAHQRGIIHRDIKPSNILFNAENVAVLADFSIVRFEERETKERLTGTGVQIGTADYMSPEAWHGDEQDQQADIWALGVVFFEMLSGQPPFYGENMITVMRNVLEAPTPSLTRIVPEISAGMEGIIQKMLAKDKSARYQTMRELSADLSVGKPAHPIIKPRANLHNRGWLSAVMVAALMVIMSGVLVMTSLTGENQAETEPQLSLMDKTNTAIALFTQTPTSTQTLTPSHTPTSDTAQIEILRSVMVYAAPSEDATVLGELEAGLVKRVIQMTTEEDWYAVPYQTGIGWVPANEVQFMGSQAQVEIAQKPSETPSSTPSDTPTTTSTPTDSPTATSSPTVTNSPSPTLSPTNSPTATDSPTATLTATITLQPSRTPLPTNTPSPSPYPLLRNVKTTGVVLVYAQPDTSSTRLVTTSEQFEPYVAGRNADGTWLYIFYFNLGELARGWVAVESLEIDPEAVAGLGVIDGTTLNLPEIENPEIEYDALAAPPHLMASPTIEMTARTTLLINNCSPSQTLTHTQYIWLNTGGPIFPTREEAATARASLSTTITLDGVLETLTNTQLGLYEGSNGWSVFGQLQRVLSSGSHQITAVWSTGQSYNCNFIVD
jgi:serine/threonine protein kinase